MVQTVENPPCVPTLYETIRLARIVNEVTRQLKRRVQNKKLPDQIRSAIDECTKPQRSHRSRDGNLGPLDEHTVHRDIDKLNIITSVGQLSKAAAEDGLFLSATCTLPEKSAGFTQLEHCENVLCRLRALKKPKLGEQAHSDVLEEKYIANVEHLLLRYIYDLRYQLRKLILLRLVVEVHLWAQQILDQGWFSEWPNGRPPLCSTWPWNIKPSLVVLWGVCWMFVNYDTNNFEGDDQASMPGLDWGLSFSQVTTAQQAQPMDGYPHPSTQHGRDFNLMADSALVSAPQPSDEAITASRHQPPYGFSNMAPVFNPEGIYIHANPNAPPPSPFHGSSSFPYPNNPGIPTPLPRRPPRWPQTSRPSHLHVTRPANYNNTPEIIIRPAQLAQSPTPERNRRLRDPSSPQSAASEYSTDAFMHLPNVFPISSESGDSSPGGILPDPSDSPARTASSPSPLVSPIRNHEPSQRRERTAKKNERGHYFCDHDECASEQITFARKCEWRLVFASLSTRVPTNDIHSKHMDKHERPYSCSEPGCEKLQGFTYPGGLLRHEREVHKKHGGPKEALYCPHSTCKRSSGQGFTRRENFNEHLRRVHKEGGGKRDNSLEGDDNSESHVVVGRKRKRRSVASVRSDSSPVVDDPESLREEVKRLRRENEGMKYRLQRLEESMRPHHPHGC
ncbi:MAG: hypothetical protein M1839_002274 [Geoglossum umbratile]|nr:MAG: hypothetical protein M1839_002274 [Geoglossum umbratile]